MYYATVSGWWEWAPPSTCWRQPYWPTYGVFSAAVTRLCALLSVGSLVAETVLLHPTTTAQAALTLTGALPDAVRCSRVYHELNGVTAWFSEDPGVLDRASIDYEIFDDETLVASRVEDGWLVLDCGRFRNIILPAASVIEAALADRLVELAASGGRVICVETPPTEIIGAGAETYERFRRAVDTGLIVVVPNAQVVPSAMLPAEFDVRADAPLLVRRHGDALILVLNSHDAETGTQAPIIPGHRNLNWVEDSFRWDHYWTTLAERGYDFVPVGSRRARVRICTEEDLRAQQWDPRSGERTELTVRRSGESLEVDVPFADGSMSVVVLAKELPPATVEAPGELLATMPIDGPWRLRAESTLDNRWADLGDATERGVLPLQLWRFEHSSSDGGSPGWTDPTGAPSRGVIATFGPYVRTQGPITDRPSEDPPRTGYQNWRPTEYSLSRGILKDELHFEYLGPKGMVPEEFLAWPTAQPGDWVAFRTELSLPSGVGRHLVVGANARRRIFLAGGEVHDVDGAGYWTNVPLGDQPANLDLEVWLLGDDALSPNPKDGPTSGVRASFAVVTDLDLYLRPEWIVPADGPVAGSVVTVSQRFRLDRAPASAVVQIATEGPCVVSLNGQEVGRQGAFEPYPEMRQMRVHPYDLADQVVTGENLLELRLTDPGRPVAVLVDSIRSVDGGLGLVTGPGWQMNRDGTAAEMDLRAEQWTDPRWVCLFARPHPLPRAAWLDPAAGPRGAVLDLVPNALGNRPRTEWLRFAAPVGAISATVNANVPFTASIAGSALPVDTKGSIRFPEPLSPEDTIVLRFDTAAGHSAGALLRGPVTVELEETQAPLLDWQELGLRSLGGQVTYTCQFELGQPDLGQTVVLDLGTVRGSAEVRINESAGQVCVWSPYRFDLTAHLVSGVNTLAVVVRGTLAGYLDDASPTPAIAAGQARAGLFGPVTVEIRRRDPAAAAAPTAASTEARGHCA